MPSPDTAEKAWDERNEEGLRGMNEPHEFVSDEDVTKLLAVRSFCIRCGKFKEHEVHDGRILLSVQRKYLYVLRATLV